MSDFTYESKNRTDIYETYEWDNVWIDCADEPDASRVLYIGDSISCGTRRIATALSNEKIHFDGFGTSKGIDNPYFKDSVSLFAKQEPRRDAVVFNNGLHGWHLDDEKEYGYHFEKMVQYLLEEFSETPLLIALTTHVADEERDARVVERNKVASAVADKYRLPVIDLYSVTLEHADLISGDGVHLTSDGYKLIANEILSSLSKLIK